MEQETHTGHLAIQQEVRSGKGTDFAYLRHLKNYEKFTENDQACRLAEDSTWKVLPPHPITVVKAATFLDYETKRLKCTSDGQDLPGTQLGVEAIKQCISTLEYWHHNNQHREDYKQCSASRVVLCDDSHITTLESTAQEKEPE
ncbi:hypothetical protein L208DRAFT_1346420 [Tricholoma matsutake]|nr:hypothetical protein L208DRAFT_1346420 [Tricholoma matsutake 945]